MNKKLFFVILIGGACLSAIQPIVAEETAGGKFFNDMVEKPVHMTQTLVKEIVGKQNPNNLKLIAQGFCYTAMYTSLIMFGGKIADGNSISIGLGATGGFIVARVLDEKLTLCHYQRHKSFYDLGQCLGIITTVALILHIF